MGNQKSKMHTLQFLKDWIYWAESYGEDINGGFQKSLGLCPSIEGWLAEGRRLIPFEEVEEAIEYFSYLIPKSDLYPEDPENCPFGGWSTYLKEWKENTAHKNAERLSWVRETIIKLTKDLENQ
jgi:hypothetical protein